MYLQLLVYERNSPLREKNIQRRITSNYEQQSKYVGYNFYDG